MRALRLLALAACLAPAASARAGETLDVRAWLDRPGVKLLAVEFYATWCKPCMEAVPQWKALHERYASQGLRLVVVATQDPKGGCVNPGWNPDDVVCDYEGFIARSFGAAETLPAAFLWSWQGRLLVRQGHVEQVDAAIQKWMKEAPRVDLEVSTEGGVDGGMLRELIRAKLNDYDKLTVIATKEERAKLDALKKESFKARFDDKLQCEVGKELSANSLLRAQVLGKAPKQRLQLGLFSAERGCLVASSVVDWNGAKPNVSVSEAVGELIQKLHSELELPRSAKSELAFGGGTAVEIRVPEINIAPAGGLGNLNLKVEQLLDRAKGAEQNKAGAPEEKAAAWCALAAVTEKNPYREKAQEGCQSWRSYARAFRKQSAALDEDYHTLAGYLALERTSLEQRIAAIDAFLAAYRGAADDRRSRAVQDARASLTTGHEGVKLEDQVAPHAAACEAHDAPACTLLANMYAKGTWPVSQDMAKASELWAKGCTGGDVSACISLGGQLVEGKGVPKDTDKAAIYYESACEADEAAGCLGLGTALAATSGDAAKTVRAARAYQRACELGDGTGCSKAGALYRENRGGPDSAARAVEVERRGCELGDVAACFEAAKAWDQGAKVARDAAKALALYKKACDAGTTPACTRLAEMTERGEGVERDPAKAAALFERSCEAKETLACESLAELYLGGRGVKKDAERGAKLLEKACDGGLRSACTRLGHVALEGIGGKVDKDRAAALFDRACKDGDGDACTSLGTILAEGKSGSADRALGLFQLGCDRGDKAGCARAEEIRQREAAHAAAKREREESRAAKAEWRSTGWWLVVPGILAGGGAGAFAYLGQKTNDDVRAGGYATADDIDSAVDLGQTFNLLGAALGIAGGALVTLGLPMILFNLDPGPLPETEGP